MKHVNGDLDDLFRRASDRYPLRADGADWDRLANALDKDPEPSSDNVEGKRRRRGIFWWFLLVPLAGLGYLTWQVGAHHSLGKGIVVASVGNGAAVRSGKVLAPVTGVGQAGSAVGGGGAGAGGAAGQAGSVAGVDGAGQAGSGDGAGGVGQAGSSVGGEKVRKVRTRAVEGANAGGDRGSRGGDQGVLGGGKVRKMRTGNTGGGDAAGLNGTGPARLNGAGSAKLAGIGAADGSTGVGMATGGTMGTRAIGNGGEGGHDPALALLDLRRAPIGGSYKVVVDVVAPKAAADGTVPAAKKQSRKVSHGYIGILGAPDFSMVKFQSMKGVGTTFGLLLGYSFNDRWAVESGVYLDRKRYYTEGEYFSTKNVSLTPGYNLLNVDGTCFMWEIPLNIRYNFNKSEKMKWFATAGLSTYLMTKEDYTYQYSYWSGGPANDSAWKINKPSQYWFSVVNLSVGYEQRLGKIGKLRLEPYVRLPLSGIGTGRLPIMSTGLNIGFTRRLW